MRIYGLYHAETEYVFVSSADQTNPLFPAMITSRSTIPSEENLVFFDLSQ
jgi:hypothetical protein